MELCFSQHEYFTAILRIFTWEGRNDTQIYLHQQSVNEHSPQKTCGNDQKPHRERAKNKKKRAENKNFNPQTTE